MPSVKVKQALSIQKISRVLIIPTREIMNNENSMEGRRMVGWMKTREVMKNKKEKKME